MWANIVISTDDRFASKVIDIGARNCSTDLQFCHHYRLGVTRPSTLCKVDLALKCLSINLFHP